MRNQSIRQALAALIAVGAAFVASPSLAQAPATMKPGQTFKDCPDCQTMVVIPAGRFLMGSTPEERAREGVPASFAQYEGPVTEITFAKPFAMATTETTRGQYARFVKETKRPVPTECAVYNPEQDNWGGIPGKSFSWQSPGFEQTDDHPAVCISWVDARDYAAWLSKKTGKRYRLASEAEWEYAARGGTKTTRDFGDSVTPICEKANIMTTATFEAIGRPESWMDAQVCTSERSWSVPVASYDPNPFGLYDMLGGVWEWISDCSATTLKGIPTDGSPQMKGDCERRITKGGAFHSRSWLARPATRGGGQSATNRPVASGIRVVREID